MYLRIQRKNKTSRRKDNRLCPHDGHYELIVPAIYHSVRVGKKVTGVPIMHLPCIRSCCVNNPYFLAYFWDGVHTMFEYAEKHLGKWVHLADKLRQKEDSFVDKLGEFLRHPTDEEWDAYFEFLKDKDARVGYDEQTKDGTDDGVKEDLRWIVEEFNAALQILGLTSEYTEEQLKAAYRKAVFQNHPDRGGSHDAIVAINQARDLLGATLGA